jgi:hypothetical protein
MREGITLAVAACHSVRTDKPRPSVSDVNRHMQPNRSLGLMEMIAGKG